MEKECKKHGVSDHVKLKSGRIKCRVCQREYQREHYKKKKSYYKERSYNRKSRQREFIKRVRQKCSCKICGEKRWWVLDFHHKDPKEKDFALGLVIGMGLSMEKIKEEIRKCDVLCANCHRDLHYKEKIARK